MKSRGTSLSKHAMKMFRSFSLLSLFLLAGLLSAFPRSARAEVSFQFFYDALSPHGHWLQVADYGYCWRPEEVDADWAPYSDGYWTYTDAGWTWVSYEDWGGITYHYGRWTQVEDEGWCWVPGHEWGPAWVSWRNSDDYVGWAPLPPEAHWQPAVGFSVWVDHSYDIGPGYYNFCHAYDFGAPLLRPCIVPRSQNVAIINKTVNITNITYNNVSKVVYNGGPNFAAMNRRSRRPIPALKLVQHSNVDDLRNPRDRRGGRAGGLLPSEQRGNQLDVIAPTVTTASDPNAVKPTKVAKVIPKEKVNKGWASVKDPEQRRAIKQQMEQQTRNLSPETAPAKPVQVADLEVLPEKADPNAPSPAKTGKDKVKGNDKKVADVNDEKGSGKNKDGHSDAAATDATGANEKATAAGNDSDHKGKGQGRNKTEAISAPVPVSPDAPVATTEGDKGDRRQDKGGAADKAEKQRQKEIANAQEKAAKRRALEKETARDDAELAAARARRQQEAANAQEQKQQQRAAAAEFRGRQRGDDSNNDEVVAGRQRQQQDQAEAVRQQVLRDRQAQREVQQQRALQQQQQQQRALEAQRAAQQQRQAQMQKQPQQQQQPQQRQQVGGGGGNGGGGKHQQQTDEEQQKKKNRGY